jgi:hypothetical protein
MEKTGKSLAHWTKVLKKFGAARKQTEPATSCPLRLADQRGTALMSEHDPNVSACVAGSLCEAVSMSALELLALRVTCRREYRPHLGTLRQG